MLISQEPSARGGDGAMTGNKRASQATYDAKRLSLEFLVTIGSADCICPSIDPFIRSREELLVPPATSKTSGASF